MPILLPFGRVLGDEKIWKDADKVIPERFKEDGVDFKFQFSPFGFAGGRVCPGRSFTYIENIVLSTLFKNFEVEFDQNVNVKCDFALLTSPIHEITAKITKRK